MQISSFSARVDFEYSSEYSQAFSTRDDRHPD